MRAFGDAASRGHRAGGGPTPEPDSTLSQFADGRQSQRQLIDRGVVVGLDASARRSAALTMRLRK